MLAEGHGYASDITRTYVTAQSNAAHEAHAAFTSLPPRCETIRLTGECGCAGGSYVELQQLMHEQLAEILTTHHILKCSAQEAFAHGLTEARPMLGHLLGLRADVWQQISESGELRPPPENYPRCVSPDRSAKNMVLTETRLYFIPVLVVLSKQSRLIQLALNRRTLPIGGIRIMKITCACCPQEWKTRHAMLLRPLIRRHPRMGH